MAIKSHYRLDKTSLWIHTIPRLIDASFFVSRQNSNQNAQPNPYPGQVEDGNENNAMRNNVKDDLRKKNSPDVIQTGSDTSYSALQGYLLFFGLILFIINVCACLGILYQRRRIREREANIRHELRRLSLEAVFPNDEQTTMNLEGCFSNNKAMHDNDKCRIVNSNPNATLTNNPDCPECQMAEMQQQAANNGINPMLLPRHGPDAIIIDEPYRPQQFDLQPVDQDVVSPRKFHLPKVLPDFPLLLKSSDQHPKDGAHKKSSRSPPSPIIEMIPVSEYEKLHPNAREDIQTYETFSFPKFEENPFAHYSRVPLPCPTGKNRNIYNVNQGSTFHSPQNSCVGGQESQYQSETWPLVASGNGKLHEGLSQQSPTQVLPIEAELPLATPVLSVVGDKTPPGTLKRNPPAANSSVKDWCSKYSQSYLSKTLPSENDSKNHADIQDKNSVEAEPNEEIPKNII